MFQQAARFVSAPASARPLAAFRIGLALVLLAQAFTLAGSLGELYGSRGVVQWSLLSAISPPNVPTVGWLVAALAPLGVSEDVCVRAVFALYVAGLAGLLVGWRTRSMAALAWLTQMALKVSGTASVYGVDEFAHLALFYCLFVPVGRAWSLDVLAGRASGEPSAGARLGLRVLQLHLCIVYFASGVEKASGIQWWNGEAIWRAVMRPDMGQFDFTWLASVPWLAMLLCWGTLVLEVFYPVFVWPARTRRLWALGIIGLHAGIAVALGLVSFSAVMIVLTGSAFLVSAAPATEAQRAEEGARSPALAA